MASSIFDNLSTSIKLHKINKLIVINHFDCGAAKMTKKILLNKSEEINIHSNSFKKLKNVLERKFPRIKTEFFLFFLNKKIKKLIYKFYEKNFIFYFFSLLKQSFC